MSLRGKRSRGVVSAAERRAAKAARSARKAQQRKAKRERVVRPPEQFPSAWGEDLPEYPAAETQKGRTARNEDRET